MERLIWVNNVSGNGLMPDGTKPLPDSMLTYHWWGPAASTCKQFHGKCSGYQLVKVENYTFKITATSPSSQCMTIPSIQFLPPTCPLPWTAVPAPCWLPCGSHRGRSYTGVRHECVNGGTDAELPGHPCLTSPDREEIENTYCKICNISGTKSQNLNDSRLVLQLPLPNPLEPGVKFRMKMWLEQRRQVMLQLHLSDQQVYCLRCVLY